MIPVRAFSHLLVFEAILSGMLRTSVVAIASSKRGSEYDVDVEIPKFVQPARMNLRGLPKAKEHTSSQRRLHGEGSRDRSMGSGRNVPQKDDDETLIGWPKFQASTGPPTTLSTGSTTENTGNPPDSTEESFPGSIWNVIDDNVVLDYFVKYYLNDTIPEIISATKLWFKESDVFKKFARLLYEMSTYKNLSWRTYGQPCIIPADELDMDKTNTSEQTNNTKFTFEAKPRPWTTITQERNQLAMKVVKIIKQSYTDNVVVGDFNKTVHEMLVTLRTRKISTEVEEIYKSLRNLAGSIRIQCDPINYLSCNPFFKDDSEVNTSLPEMRTIRITKSTAGNCDCRESFSYEGDKCYVKKYEDCNLINLLNDYDYKILPNEIIYNIKKPQCSKGLECLNGFVCYSSATEIFLSSLDYVLLLITAFILNVM